MAGPRIQASLLAGAQAGWFYAAGEQPNENVISTLPSIRWQQAALAFFGPAVAVEAAR